MESNLSQTFEDSRQAVNDYIKYISRLSGEQQEKDDYSLNSVMKNVDGVGTIAAMAAKESMVSHNTIFGMLKAMDAQQGLLTQMVVELRLNGGVGGGSAGGTLDGALTWGGLGAGVVSLFELAHPWFWAFLGAGALLGTTEESDQETARQGELSHSNSLTNQALEASAEAQRFINQAYYSLNPAPNPLMNGPGMLQKSVKFKDLPFVRTPGDAFAVVAAFNEANNYREATGQISPRPQNLHEDFGEDYNNFSEYGNVMEYYLGHDISNLQPQSVQVVAQPASTSVAPEQTINFNIQNDFNGNWQDRRGLEDIGEYLARQVKDRLNSGAPLFSGNR